jgi:hypothetical protein
VTCSGRNSDFAIDLTRLLRNKHHVQNRLGRGDANKSRTATTKDKIGEKHHPSDQEKQHNSSQVLKTQVAAMIGDLPFFLLVFTPLRGAKAGMISNTSDEADSSETHCALDFWCREARHEGTGEAYGDGMLD